MTEPIVLKFSRTDLPKFLIAIDNIITELRLISGDDMLANCLTKGGQNGEALIDVLRGGSLHVPGGETIQSSMKIHSSTWQKLIEAQSESFRSIHDWRVGVNNMYLTKPNAMQTKQTTN